MSSSVLLLRMVLALVVVFALLGVAAKFAQRRFGSSGSGVLGTRKARVDIVMRANVAKSASVVVVHLGDRELVLGVTSQQVTLLSEGQIEAAPIPSAATNIQAGSHGLVSPMGGATPASPWTTMLDRLRERTIRHA